MGQKMLRFALSDIKLFRITCTRCNRGVVELPLEQLHLATDNGNCRFCGDTLLPEAGREVLSTFKRAMQDLTTHPKYLRIDFDMPDPGTS